MSLYIILPYINPSGHPNEPLKHNSQQFYIKKTEVRSRCGWDAGALLGTKIHLVGPGLTQFNTEKQAFPATKRPKARSYVFQIHALQIHCPHCAEIMESLSSH